MVSRESRVISSSDFRFTDHVNNMSSLLSNLRQISLTAAMTLMNTSDEKNRAVPYHVNGTVVVSLKGELGNHLSIISQGVLVKLLAKEKHGIHANLVLRHDSGQFRGKYFPTGKKIQRCFPKLRQYNFSEANSPEFDRLQEEQNQQLADNNMIMLTDSQGKGNLLEALSLWKHLLTNQTLNVTTEGPVTAPFFHSTLFAEFADFDKGFDEIRDFLEYDKDECCKTIPDPDESVFVSFHVVLLYSVASWLPKLMMHVLATVVFSKHYRNFHRELRGRWNWAINKGFLELSPNKTANELFGHLKPGDKVVITTRMFKDDNTVDAYVAALKQRGLQVRVISNQTDVEDFCFLMNAKKELVGSTKSTFAKFAAILGDMDRAELYQMKDPKNRKYNPGFVNLTHPVLKKRLFFTTYKSENQSRLEMMQA